MLPTHPGSPHYYYHNYIHSQLSYISLSSLFRCVGELEGPISGSGGTWSRCISCRSGNVLVTDKLHARGMRDVVGRCGSIMISGGRRRGGRSGNVLEGDNSHGGGGNESNRVIPVLRFSTDTTVSSILVMAGPLGPVGGCLALDLVTVSGCSLMVVSSAFPRIRR